MNPLDLAKIAAHITDLTGHAQGTFEHESMFGRVLGELASTGIATVRSDNHEFRFILDRAEFERVAVVAGGAE